MEGKASSLTGPGLQEGSNTDIQKWISKNKQKCLLNTVPLRNYWTLLASQVKVLDPDHLLSIHSNAPRRITFTLSPSHIDRDSTEY